MVIRETIDIHNLINIKIVLLKFLLIERTRVSTIFDLFVTSMRRLIQHRKFRVSPRKYKSKLFADFKLDSIIPELHSFDTYYANYTNRNFF